MGKKITGIFFLVMAVVGAGISLTNEGWEALPPTILFAIIGLVLLVIKGKSKDLTETKERRSTKKPILIGCALVVGLPVAVAIASGATSERVVSERTPPTQKRSLLAETMDLTEEQEAEMLACFASCGIGEITVARNVQDREERSSYHVHDKETQYYNTEPIVVYVNNTTKKVEDIYYRDYDILVDGVQVSTLPLFYASKEQRETMMLYTQHLVTQLLSYPDMAEFTPWRNWRTKGVYGKCEGVDCMIEYKVQAEVKAMNAFGVKSTLVFTATFDFQTAEITSLIFDGKEYLT